MVCIMFSPKYRNLLQNIFLIIFQRINLNKIVENIKVIIRKQKKIIYCMIKENPIEVFTR